MNPKPVLRAIRSILKFKDNTTIAEIAGIAELSKAKVLDVVNDNLAMLTIDKKTGKIFSENLSSALRCKMYHEGKTYLLYKYKYQFRDRIIWSNSVVSYAADHWFKSNYREPRNTPSLV